MEDTPIPIAEIEHGPSKLEVFFDKNIKFIIAAAVSVFLGVLGYVGYTGYAAMLNAEAGEALTIAVDEDELQAVKAAHKDTASAAAASLLIADIKGNESPTAAIELLNEFIGTYPNHAAIATATTSLGLRLMNAGKLEEAKEHLTAVIDLDNAEHISPIAQIALGDIAQLEGDATTAKEFYTAVTDLISDDSSDPVSIAKYSPYKSLAGNRIRFIGAIAPIEEEKQLEAENPPTDIEAITNDADSENQHKEESEDDLEEKNATPQEKDETNEQKTE